jgi:hypothetical protein
MSIAIERTWPAMSLRAMVGSRVAAAVARPATCNAMRSTSPPRQGSSNWAGKQYPPSRTERGRTPEHKERPAMQGFRSAPGRTRTSTDHKVHKALNLVSIAWMLPPASESFKLRRSAAALDGLDEVDVVTSVVTRSALHRLGGLGSRARQWRRRQRDQRVCTRRTAKGGVRSRRDASMPRRAPRSVAERFRFGGRGAVPGVGANTVGSARGTVRPRVPSGCFSYRGVGPILGSGACGIL